MAVAVATAVTFLAYRHLRLNAEGMPTVHIVAAAEDLPAGVTLTSQNVTLIDWHASTPPAGSFSKIEDVIGRPVIDPVDTNELILDRKLAAEGSGIGLSAKIPPGMRATAVKSDEVVGVGGFLYPGSHVDVLATYNQQGTAGPLTVTVLQNVEVLTAGQTIQPDPQGKPQTVNVVTLLLSPDDSQKLLLTSTQGAIQFVLRSGVDQKKVDLMPTHLDELIPSAKPVVTTPKSAPRLTPKLAPAPPPPVFVLEVIQGTQRTEQKF
jgi:pilus assembly protein CpaB